MRVREKSGAYTCTKARADASKHTSSAHSHMHIWMQNLWVHVQPSMHVASPVGYARTWSSNCVKLSSRSPLFHVPSAVPSWRSRRLISAVDSRDDASSIQSLTESEQATPSMQCSTQEEKYYGRTRRKTMQSYTIEQVDCRYSHIKTELHVPLDIQTQFNEDIFLNSLCLLESANFDGCVQPRHKLCWISIDRPYSLWS